MLHLILRFPFVKYRHIYNVFSLNSNVYILNNFSASTLLGVRKGIRTVKKTACWGAGVVISLERSADLHTAQLMPLPLTGSCFSKIQIGFTFLVPAHPGSPGQMSVKRVCVCARVCKCRVVESVRSVCVCICVCVCVCVLSNTDCRWSV